MPEPTVAQGAETVAHQLQRMACDTQHRDKTVYTFLDDAGAETINYTFADVDLAARRIAATLQRKGGVQRGDRVVLCYPPGLDFALVFWGCLYAGAVAVPLYPPYPGTLATDLPKFCGMVALSGAHVILTNRAYRLASQLATITRFLSFKAVKWPQNMPWIKTDRIADAAAAKYDPRKAESTLDDVAFIQHTSGSTGAPKPVKISHGNLRAQLRSWGTIAPTDTLVSWLPSYHDMGLVGFIIAPCMFAARCVAMSPISFIKDPALWMHVASQYRATHVCAPSFGYALVARKTTDEAARALNLSTLKQTICAAGPIRAAALEAFTAKFQVAGFDPKTFNCGYGLAEATLVCTGQDPLQRKPPTVLCFDKHALETQQRATMAVPVGDDDQADASRAVTLVGCGKAMPTFTVVIADPETNQQLAEDGQVGEVWIRGASVSTGYYGDDDASSTREKTFNARLQRARDPTHTYFRTGDLGFLFDGELFVTARVTDLIVLQGRHAAPQHVETTVESAHAHVRPGCVAALSLPQPKGGNGLVVIAEVKQTGLGKHAYAEICRQIRADVWREHQLRCATVVLLREKKIPKTTSGKIQRGMARAKFQSNGLTRMLYESASDESKTLVSTVCESITSADEA